jgi:hypothetical protein
MLDRKKRLTEYARRYRQKRRAILRELKSERCVDCLRKFPPECMDFDHVKGKKKFSISRCGTINLDSFLREI